ncbi:transposase [Polaromonas sp. YR568]|uniref:transposase n=1 Tax=Polaromonas sp. YR568 TaxID=1855301 RepID=UPI00398BC929
MARLPRLTLPGCAHHIIQRGNNRQTVFSSAADQQMLLTLLGESARKFGVALHAYVLMDNHFHLLATPSTADGLPQMMQAAGRRYVRYYNDSQGRSGTLWEGRYRATVIHAERYLLPCMAYMDLNPVRAGLVAEAKDYPWSSYRHYAGLRVDSLLTPHPLVWALGNTPFAREAAYAELVRAGITLEQQDLLTRSALSGWALGEGDFLAELQKRTERRVSKNQAGRPPMMPKEDPPLD